MLLILLDSRLFPEVFCANKFAQSPIYYSYKIRLHDNILYFFWKKKKKPTTFSYLLYTHNFLSLIFFICMCIACVLYLRRPEGITVLGFGNKPHNADTETQTGPLAEQRGLWTAELSLQLCFLFVLQRKFHLLVTGLS